MQPNTKLLFAETPTNPLTDVCDILALADVAHGAGALLAVDNCFCSPALQRPASMGADVVIHSGTKYLDGQGRVIAGALCASRELVQSKLIPVMRSAGMSLSPFNAWVVLKAWKPWAFGWKPSRPELWHWPSGWSSTPQWRGVLPWAQVPPQHDLAMRQQSGMGGAVLSFDIKAVEAAQARARAFHVIDSTQLMSVTANLGDVKTIITHPPAPHMGG